MPFLGHHDSAVEPKGVDEVIDRLQVLVQVRDRESLGMLESVPGIREGGREAIKHLHRGKAQGAVVWREDKATKSTGTRGDKGGGVDVPSLSGEDNPKEEPMTGMTVAQANPMDPREVVNLVEIVDGGVKVDFHVENDSDQDVIRL